jgi:hypothetical protein
MTALLFSLCTKVVAQESNKKEKVILQINLLYLKITTTKLLLKLKTKTEKVVADKKIRRFNNKKKI